MDDVETIKRCQQGTRKFSATLWSDIKNERSAQAMVILFNRDDAEDAVQDAFIDAFKAIGTFDTSRTFYQWFYVLLRNRCYKLTGRRRPTESLDEASLLAPQPGMADETRLRA